MSFSLLKNRNTAGGRDYGVLFPAAYLVCLGLWSLLFTVSTEIPDSPIMLFSGRLWQLIRLFLFVKLVFYDLPNSRRSLFGIGLILLGIVTRRTSGNDFMEPFFWFAGSAYNVKIRDIVKTLFFTQLAALLTAMTMALTGVVDNITYRRGDSSALRYSMGFYHPNTLAQKVFQLCVMYVYLLGRKLRLPHIALVALISVVVYYITDSRTALFMSLYLILMLLAYLLSVRKVWPFYRLSERGMRLLRFVFFAAAALSVAISLTASTVNYARFLSVGDTLMSRVTQMQLYLSAYSLKPFGQYLYYAGSSLSASIRNENLYTLDNSYMYLILGYGVVTTAVYLALMFFTLRKAVREKNYLILIILSAYALYGLTETLLLRLSLNFSLMLMAAALWNVPFGSGDRRYRLKVDKETLMRLIAESEERQSDET